MARLACEPLRADKERAGTEGSYKVAENAAAFNRLGGWYGRT